MKQPLARARSPSPRRAKKEPPASQAGQPAAAPDCVIERRDFAAFLADLDADSVDLALTDPPYAISKKTGFSQVKTGVQRFAVSMDFGKWDQKPVDLEKLANGLYKALRRGGTAIVWYDLWKITPLAEAMGRAGFKMLRMIIWQKTNPVPLNSQAIYLSNSREMAVLGVKHGSPTFHGCYHPGVYAQPIPRHNGCRLHPTQKPVGLFRELVQMHSDAGDLVIDPFLGSGTTAVAALQEKRRFAGCDMDPGYVRAAQKRLAEDRAVEPIFRPGSKAAQFLEWAQPDADGFSKEVLVQEMPDGLQLGNGGSWCRDSGPLAQHYNVVRRKERGRIVAVALEGHKKQPARQPKRGQSQQRARSRE